jgi:magnesium transporter
MLRYFPNPSDEPSSEAQPPVWADLWDANTAEQAEAERRLGVKAPSRGRLSEIERSSRLQVRNGVLTMSVPMIDHVESTGEQAAPVGFVLSPTGLVTLRYAALKSFEAVAQKFDDPESQPASSLQVFVELCDEITDRLADNLEEAAAELHGISTAIFHVPEGEGRAAIRSSRRIRSQLRQVGRLGDRVSETRAALLGIGRAVDFACELTGAWDGGGLEPRMRNLQRDVASLNDYQVHLSDKIQFLLDAIVGLIGIAQNEVFKFLTIVSIIGIPPTLIAGIYGMNFKTMPEYDWAFGYPYGLAVIALSAILPLAWFKWRGWF